MTKRRRAHELHVLAAAADIILRARLGAVRLAALARLQLIVMPKLRKDLGIGVAAARAVVFLQAGRGARRLDDRGDAAVALISMAERLGAAALNDIGFSARQARTVDTAKLGISLLGAGRLDNVLYRGVLVVGAWDGIHLHLTAACARAVLDAVGAGSDLLIDHPVAPVMPQRRGLFLIPVAALRAHIAHIARLRARGIMAGGDQLVAGRGQHDTVCRAAVLAHGDDGTVHRAGRLGARRLPRVFVEIDEVNMEARVRARDLRVIVLQCRRGEDIGDLIAVVITDRQILKDRHAILGGGRAVRHDGSVAAAAELHVHARRAILRVELIGRDQLICPLERHCERAQLARVGRAIVQRVVQLQLPLLHIGQDARAVADDVRRPGAVRCACLNIISTVRHRAEADKAIGVGHGGALDVFAVSGRAGELKRHPRRNGRIGPGINGVIPCDIGRGAQRRGNRRRLFVLQIVKCGILCRRPRLVLEIRDELGLVTIRLFDLQPLDHRRQIGRAAARDGEGNIRHDLRRCRGKHAAGRRRERIPELKVARVVLRRGGRHVREAAAVGIDRQALAVIQHVRRDLVDRAARHPEPIGIRKCIADMECPRRAGARVHDQLVAGFLRRVTAGGKRLQTANRNEHQQRHNLLFRTHRIIHG